MKSDVTISILKSDLDRLKKIVEEEIARRDRCERELLHRIEELERKSPKDLGWRS